MNQDNNTFIPNNQNGAAPNNTGATGQFINPGQVAVNGQVVTQAVPAAQPQAAVVDPTLQNNVATSTNPNVIICPKCGSEMKKESRYCMKCGNLNYAHPDNESMKQYAWQNIKQGYFISGANVDNKQPLTMGNVDSLSNASPFKACIITNVILHLLMAVGMFLLVNSVSLLGGSVSAGAIITIAVSVVISFIINYSVQAMYIKAGEPWWGYFVPFYSNYIMFKIALGNGWLFLVSVIPVVGVIVALIALYQLGKKFYKNGWLTLFFPFIMIPIIAFDKNSEYSLLAKDTTAGLAKVDAKGKTESEKIYGRNKFIITSIVIVVLAVGIYFAWPYLQPIVEKIWTFVMEQIESFK